MRYNRVITPSRNLSITADMSPEHAKALLDAQQRILDSLNYVEDFMTPAERTHAELSWMGQIKALMSGRCFGAAPIEHAQYIMENSK